MARFEQEREDRTYRYYVTDSLRNIPQRKWMAKGFLELLDDINHPQDIRSGEEIALDIISRAGLKAK